MKRRSKQDINVEPKIQTEERVTKSKEIEDAIGNHNIQALSALAMRRHGLISSSLRRLSWPVLLSDVKLSEPTGKKGSWRELPPHADEPQVLLDVNRSFIYYPFESSDYREKSTELLKDLRSALFDLIKCVLRNYPELSYYQGYHDIAQVVLLVYDGDADAAASVLETFTLQYLRDFMMPSINVSIDHLALIPPLVTLADPFIGEKIRNMEPHYALSSIITLYAHHIHKFEDICTVFDYIMAAGTKSPIFIYVALASLKKREIKECDGDTDMIHSTLSTIAEADDVDIYELTSKAKKLSDTYALEEISPWNNISQFSTLKARYAPDIVIKQVAETNTRNTRELELKRKEADALQRKKHLASSWLRRVASANRRVAPGVLGASLCIGVFGVILSLYHENLRSTLRDYL